MGYLYVAVCGPVKVAALGAAREDFPSNPEADKTMDLYFNGVGYTLGENNGRPVVSSTIQAETNSGDHDGHILKTPKRCL